MTTFIYPTVTIPGVELEHRFGTASASQSGSENYPGVRSPVVDALIRAVLRAKSLEELQTATHALDRVLIAGCYQIPEYYSPASRIAYRTSLGFPDLVPYTYQAEDWVISYWYRKPSAASVASANAH
jgi:microcin C transport system substrate-binding protein